MWNRKVNEKIHYTKQYYNFILLKNIIVLYYLFYLLDIFPPILRSISIGDDILNISLSHENIKQIIEISYVTFYVRLKIKMMYKVQQV